MHEDFSESSGESIRAFLRILRRRWWLVLACLIVVPAAAFGYDRLQTRQYTATTNLLLVDPSSSDQVLANQGSVSAADQATLMSTALSIGSLSVISDNTAKALGPPYSGSSLPGNVVVNNDGNSNIITVTATERTGALAALVANTYATQYSRFSTGQSVSRIRKEQSDLRAQIRTLNRQGSNRAAAALGARLSQLTTLSALQNTQLQVVTPATAPSSPSSPKTARIVLAGVVLGLLLGILLALLFAMLDRRLRDTGDVQVALRGPILGVVPRSRALAKAWGGDGDGPDGLELESFAMIYANLNSYNTDNPVRSVLVTSANGGEGKSTVAWNLALVAAHSGARVLLIEADMRKPTIAARIGADVNAGLVDLLSRRHTTLGDVIKVVPMSARPSALLSPGGFDSPEQNGNGTAYDHRLNGQTNGHGHDADGYSGQGSQPESASRSTVGRYRRRWRGMDPRARPEAGVTGQSTTRSGAPGRQSVDPEAEHAKLEVLFAGQLSRRGLMQKSPSAMLASKQMRDLIKGAEDVYDLVIIDSPPPTAVPDAIPLVGMVSGVIVVSRVGKNTRDTAARLRSQLENLNARTLGVVVNGVETRDEYYGPAAGYLRRGVAETSSR